MLGFIVVSLAGKTRQFITLPHRARAAIDVGTAFAPCFRVWHRRTIATGIGPHYAL
jgi:hypothetical protein